MLGLVVPGDTGLVADVLVLRDKWEYLDIFFNLDSAHFEQILRCCVCEEEKGIDTLSLG